MRLITLIGRPKATVLKTLKLGFSPTKNVLGRRTSETSGESPKNGRKTSRRTDSTTSKFGVFRPIHALGKNRHQMRDYVQTRGEEYDREEQMAIIRTIQKNTLNNKILNKRVVGGS